MTNASPPSPPAGLNAALARAARLGMIIAAHAALLFFAVSASGFHAPASSDTPQTVFVSFVAPPAPQPVAVQPPKQQPKPKPKPDRLVQKPLAPTPLTEPSPRAIEAPPVDEAPPPPPAPPVAPVAAAPAAAPAAPPPPPATPRTITSGIQYLQAPAPEYPAAARRMGEEGQVVMRVLVNERGRPERTEVQTSSGSSRLDDAARRAVLRAVFKPHIEDGRPIAVFAVIPIRFQLDS